MKKVRPPRKLPKERLVSTEEASGVLCEDPITAHNKSDPRHDSYDPDHPKPIRGAKGAPSKWWLPDLYQYIEVLKQRSDKRERQLFDVEQIERRAKRGCQHDDADAAAA